MTLSPLIPCQLLAYRSMQFPSTRLSSLPFCQTPASVFHRRFNSLSPWHINGKSFCSSLKMISETSLSHCSISRLLSVQYRHLNSVCTTAVCPLAHQSGCSPDQAFSSFSTNNACSIRAPTKLGPCEKKLIRTLIDLSSTFRYLKSFSTSTWPSLCGL